MTPTTVKATRSQRLRVRVIAAFAKLVSIVPERLVDGLAGLAGGVWYRLGRDRVALGRRNLERVVRYLAQHELGSEEVRRAATDGAALERLLRATFRETVRYYVDMARLPTRRASDLERRLAVETPAAVEAA